MIVTCVFCWSTVFLTYITLKTKLLLVQNKNVLLSALLRCKNFHDTKFVVIGGIRAASDDKIFIMTRFSDDTFHQDERATMWLSLIYSGEFDKNFYFEPSTWIDFYRR